MCVFSHMFFFFKQKTAYEMRISDWSSDVCSSDLAGAVQVAALEPTSGKSVGKPRRFQWGLYAHPQPTSGKSVGKPRRSRRAGAGLRQPRPEKRWVGKECMNTCRSRWVQEH